MYRFYLNKVNNDYHYAELCRVFLSEDEFETIGIDFHNHTDIPLSSKSYIVNASGSEDRNVIKLELLRLLETLTGRSNDWGTMTGVRPLKLAFDTLNKVGSIQEMGNSLSEVYGLADDKINLLKELIQYQTCHVTQDASGKVGIYIGIPFCPTRCAYCAFASNVAKDQDIELYLTNLLKEISYMGDLMKAHNEVIESIYIGGGTPTTLNEKQLDRLINSIEQSFAIEPANIEFTVEAGRPDTITAAKLEVLKNHGISRISINPQTMKDETLELIGRRHSAEDIVKGYELASKYDFDVINADLIAGLQGETLEDFKDSLNKVIKLGANNITVHTLSVKKGSRLIEEDPDFYRKNEERVIAMVVEARKVLRENGFYPYYMYRQKHQIGALENIGYCREGKHSLYNIRIMEEKQTIVGLGAGAIGKVYFPDEDRLERVPNVSNYQVYNERFHEMLERKNKYYGG
ncbi:MAG: coproporphyrinogen dehydrogenase HemZ [Clostridiales bacterium]|nr:coproporphyrinogen dehydrogenase HemZ [Candidatus Crickella merdequi]